MSGQRTSITYPNGETVKYSYDEFKRLTSLEEANNITTYEYDQYSHLQLKTMPNGVSTEYSYDNRGLLASLTNKDAMVYLIDIFINMIAKEIRRKL